MTRWRVCPGVPISTEHHHDRSGRYCYWKWRGKAKSLWTVRDRVTRREVVCLNLHQVHVWIGAAKELRVRHLVDEKMKKAVTEMNRRFARRFFKTRRTS